MQVGDKVRLKPGPMCQECLGLQPDQVGIVKEVDASPERHCVLISFQDLIVYTSALQDSDIEVVGSENGK